MNETQPTTGTEAPAEVANAATADPTVDAVEDGWVDALCTCGAPESHVGKFCPERPTPPPPTPPERYKVTATATFDAYSLEDAQGLIAQYFAQLRAGEPTTLIFDGPITVEKGN